MHDTVLRGGLLFDGTGAPGVRADLAIDAGRISAIGQDLPAGRTEIDAAGRCIAPGFIDVHTHSDPLPFLDEATEFKVIQGVTTEVIGNCGSSHGGLREEALPDLGLPGPVLAPEQRAGRFGAYLDLIEERGVVINTATLAGHGTLREAVGALDGPASTEQLEAMEQLLAEAFDAGAIGLSSGLEYAPGSFAVHEELTRLASIAAARGRRYATHLRSESDLVLAAIDEALAVAERTGVALHVSHLKASGPRVHGSAPAMLAALRRAREAGVDVSADVYPYRACSTPMSALLPTRSLAAGAAQLPALLADPEVRAALRAEATAAEPQNGCGIWSETTPETVLVVMHARPGVAGKTLAELTGDADPWETLCDLLSDDPHAFTVLETMAEADVRAFLAAGDVMIASDSVWPLDHGHPRTWGCFPRVLGRYVREDGVLDLAEAIRKCTAMPAERFGLLDRGVLRVGAHADIVVFDPETVGHPNDALRPWQRPTGIDTVFIGGAPVVSAGQFSGERLGRVLRTEDTGVTR